MYLPHRRADTRGATLHLVRFPAARGQHPELSCPLHTETYRRQATEERQTDTQACTQADSCKYPPQYYYGRFLRSKVRGEETREGFK